MQRVGEETDNDDMLQSELERDIDMTQERVSLDGDTGAIENTRFAAVVTAMIRALLPNMDGLDQPAIVTVVATHREVQLTVSPADVSSIRALSLLNIHTMIFKLASVKTKP